MNLKKKLFLFFLIFSGKFLISKNIKNRFFEISFLKMVVSSQVILRFEDFLLFPNCFTMNYGVSPDFTSLKPSKNVSNRFSEISRWALKKISSEIFHFFWSKIYFQKKVEKNLKILKFSEIFNCSIFSKKFFFLKNQLFRKKSKNQLKIFGKSWIFRKCFFLNFQNEKKSRKNQKMSMIIFIKFI